MYQEMDETIVLLLPVLIPIAAGVLLLTVKRLRNSRKTMISLVMAALTAVSEGTTEIVHAERVRLKECDRLHAMAVELSRLGARVEEKEDGLVIHGGVPLHGGVVSSWNDHRIAMALASISPAIEGRLTIDGADSVRKSYPRFWDDFVKTGGQCNYE